jgi:sterol desaturase/sphingolipid hydroxylase (fatty acid hydroxylase superfamily)
MFLIGLSMFYHSVIRVRLPWLNRILVTPQVHRIHRSVNAEHHNWNFAELLPIFDIVFGTYHRPIDEKFPATGLARNHRHLARSCQCSLGLLLRSVARCDQPSPWVRPFEVRMGEFLW